MGCIVICDIVNICLSTNHKNYCGIENAVESLFNLCIVCYIFM